MAELRKRIGVIGAGVMGTALARGMLDSGLIAHDQIWAAVRSESARSKAEQNLGIKVVADFKPQLPGTDILLICVKPSQIASVLADIAHANLSPKTLILSIAAGVTIQRLESESGGKLAVIRAMTNTPCVVGCGMTALSAGKHCSTEQMDLAETIFHSVGGVLRMEEKHMDAFTGLAGSGPAYIYLIMEALADGGVNVGIPRKEALKIVAQTVLGSAKMVQKTGRSPSALKDDVTTPAGCTIGALLKLEDGNIRSVLAKAVAEATKIAGKLG